MPRCAVCGNKLSFGSSVVPPPAPTANGPLSGLIADFNSQGCITEMDSLGADMDIAQEAWENPDEFFDICFHCGSNEIVWE